MEKEKKGDGPMNPKLIVGLVLIGLLVVFVIQNVAVVEIQFLLWTMSMSRALMMFFLIAIGIVIGWSLHSFKIHKSHLHDEQNHPPAKH